MNKMMIYLQSPKATPDAPGSRLHGAKASDHAGYGQSEAAKGREPADAVPLSSVVEKIKYLASLEPTELALKMDTEEGAILAQVETEPMEIESLLRPWSAIRRATPEQLTSEQYDAFLRGEHPTADAGDLYGAHLQSET